MAAGRIKGITIEINGDTTKLVSALGKVDNALSKTQANLRDINKALKLDPTNTALLKDKQQELAHAIDETRQRLQTEKEAYEQLAHADKTPENVERMRQLKTQIDLDTAALKDLERQARESASVLGTQMQAAGEKIKEVGDKIKGVGEKITSLGQTMTQHVTIPIATAFGASIKSAIDWESAFTGVMKTVDETATTTYDDLKKSINEIAKTTASSQNEIAAVMEIGGQLGVTADNLTDFTTVMIKLKDTTNLSAEEASTSLAKFANITNMSLKDVDKLGAAIVDLGNNYATSEADIVSMASRLAGAGAQIGLTQGEIVGLATAISSVGIEAEMGGSAFSKAMVKMQVAVETGFDQVNKLTKEAGMSLRDLELMSTNDTKSFKELAQSLGMTTTEIKEVIKNGNNLNNFADVAGMKTEEFVRLYRNDAPAALQAFIEGLGDTETKGESTIAMLQEMGFTEVRLRDTLTRLANSHGMVTNAMKQGNEAWSENAALETEAAKRYATMDSQLKQLKARLTEVAVQIGEMLMPYLVKLMDKVQEWIDKWNSLDQSQQEFILKIAALVAAIGPALIIVGKVITAIGVITSAIGSLVGGLGTVMTLLGTLVNPITIIIAAVAALTAAFIYFYNTNEEFRDRVNAVIESIKEVFGAFVSRIKEWLDAVLSWIAPVVDAVSQYLGAVWEYIKTVFGLIGNYVTNFLARHETAIKNFFATQKMLVSVVMDLISGIVKTKIDLIKNIFTTVLNTLSELLRAFTALLKGDWSGAMDHLKQAAQNAWDGVKRIFADLGRDVSNIFKNLIDDFKQWGKDMVDNLVDGLESRMDRVTQPVKSIASKIRSYLHFSEPDVGPLSDFSTYMPDMVDLLVKGINDGIPAVANAMNNLTTAMVPNMAEAKTNNTTNNNNVNITVYGAQGQSVDELVDVIQDRLNAEVYSKGAVFA